MHAGTILICQLQTAISRERFDLRNWNKHQIKDIDLLFLLVCKTMTFDLWNMLYAKLPLVDLWPGQSIFGLKLTLLSKFDQNWTFTLIFYKQNTFGHFHRNFIEIGTRP